MKRLGQELDALRDKQTRADEKEKTMLVETTRLQSTAQAVGPVLPF